MHQEQTTVSCLPLATQADKLAYIDDHNRWNRHFPTSLETMDRADRIWPEGHFLERYSLWSRGVRIGSALLSQMHWQSDETKWQQLCFAIPPLDALSLGRAATELTRIAVGHGCRHMSSWLLEPGFAKDVYVGLGYEQTQSNPESVLDIAGFDPEPFQRACENFAASGLKTMTLTEFLASSPSAIETWWDTHFELVADVPVPWEKKKPDLESFKKEVFECADEHETTLLALDGTDVVAVSSLAPNKVDPTLFNTGLTAVLAPYRRRGVATALKVKTLQLAKDAGGRLVSTDNEAENPMLGLNVALGFRQVHSWACMEREVG